MPERAALQAGALRDAAARLRTVQARLGRLGASHDARIGALAARWAALPAAACFDPFAFPAQESESEAAPAGVQADTARRQRARAPSTPPQTTNRRPAPQVRADSVSAAPQGPRLGAAVAQAMAGLIHPGPPGSDRQGAARKSGVSRPPAKAAPLTRGLQAGAVGAALQAALGATPPPTGRRTPPNSVGDDAAAAAAVVAAALAGVGASLRAVVPRFGAAPAASGDLPRAAWNEAQGAMLATALAAPALLQRQLAALSGAPQRNALRRAPPSSSRQGEASPASITPAAFRAPSRLLPAIVSNAAETPSRGAAQPDDPAPAADSIDALTELNRRLIDQAWLRGVDLS